MGVERQPKVPYRIFNHLFMKIAEPRVVRIIYFGIYLGFTVVGLAVWLDKPRSFESLIGALMVNWFAGFLVVGGIFGLIAVLPGIWWLERVGLISLAFGVVIYVVIIVFLGASVAGIGFSAILTLMFLLRWLDIKEFQLAPKEG